MIHLIDNYYITIDKMNITLHTKTVKGTKSKKPGEVQYKPIGYTNSFKTLAMMLERELMPNTDEFIEFEAYRGLYRSKLEKALYNLKLKEPKDL